MRFKYILLIFVSILMSLTQFVYAQKYKNHTVQKGESIYSIATSYGLSTDDIFKHNPEVSKGIWVDQVIKIPLEDSAQSQYFLHSIEPKETLYAVSKLYNVSVSDILDANPGLSSSNFKIGTAIRIPRKPSQTAAQEKRHKVGTRVHKVGSKETLYGLSKQYELSIQEIIEANPVLKIDGLKEGMEIVIPDNTVSPSQTSVSNGTSGSSNPLLIGQRKSSMRIGVLLPFADEKQHMQARFVEYYEGFLLAVEDIKAKGYSAEIYVFDIRKGTGTKKLENLLGTTEMQNLELIIGGVTDDEVAILSKFAKKNNIKYIAPFPVRSSSSITGYQTYQANIPQADLFSKVASRFYDLFKDYNVVILSESGLKNNDRTAFTNEVKDEFEKKYASVKQVDLANASSELKDVLSSGRKNIILPSSSSIASLAKLLPILKSIEAADADLQISLFGYPDWQTYTTQFLPDYHKYDTYIYTPFYVDNNNAGVKRFNERYQKWYDKTLINTYPRYGLMGYDTGIYFLTALAQDMNSFEKKDGLSNVATLQSTFYFEGSKNQEGYINTGLFFIHYKPDMTIEKINYSK